MVRLRYNLRTLATTFVALSVALAFCGKWLVRSEQQRAAVQVLQQNGYAVAYGFPEYEDGDGWHGYKVVPNPPLLAKVLGPNLFYDVMCIGHDDTSALTDEDLSKLARFPRLRSAILDGHGVTDRGLVHLRHLKELENLTLYDTSVTPQGIADLQAFLPTCDIALASKK